MSPPCPGATNSSQDRINPTPRLTVNSITQSASRDFSPRTPTLIKNTHSGAVCWSQIALAAVVLVMAVR